MAHVQPSFCQLLVLAHKKLKRGDVVVFKKDVTIFT